jgi:hypothetical protein
VASIPTTRSHAATVQEHTDDITGITQAIIMDALLKQIGG